MNEAEKIAEVHAYEGDKLVGIYIGPIRRATSWARRANPNARILQEQSNGR